MDYRELAEEKFEPKDYIRNSRLQDSRLLFQARCKMIKSVKMNFKNNPKFIQEHWSCPGCALVDSQEHLLWCSAYAHLREGLNLGDDGDLVGYYRNIMKLRKDEG